MQQIVTNKESIHDLDDNIEFIPGCTEYRATNYHPNATRLIILVDLYRTIILIQTITSRIGIFVNGIYRRVSLLMEDLNDLSTAEIEELEDCEQSEMDVKQNYTAKKFIVHTEHGNAPTMIMMMITLIAVGLAKNHHLLLKNQSYSQQ